VSLAPLRYSIPDFPFVVESNLGAEGLNSLVNQVLKGKRACGKCQRRRVLINIIVISTLYTRRWSCGETSGV